uniref:DNA replication checkpoint mediator MRC1 domain-containing protein n=1 Tax=Bionectria ochroleuca TaxID=29856 RepID=A0A8H7K7H1_BIOOC
MNGSPLIRRGRLRRKMESVAEVDEVPPTAPETEEPAPNAFGAMLKGAKKARKQKLAEDFNKKKSKAKEMVEEQAEESEDEYRGLGGADGEDSDDESVASVKEMIDDAAGNDLDESKLAAYYADQARASDEKQVEKLFKDITSGMLRRKRGADYDLSDSDDGGEARRKMKRRQFAKMQKALFSDERVKKMAENPGNQAFLRTIEDHGSDEEMDFLDITEEPRQSPESQSQEEQSEKFQVVPDSQPRSVLGSAPSNRPPAHMRRTKAGRKPTNIGEVRETLSSLLEDGREMSIIPATEAGSDSENEDVDPTPSAPSDKENHAPNPRRRGAAVVDRISLKRNSSSMMSDSGSRMAFAVQNSSSSFKVPALLRRATTNSLQSTSASSSGASTPTMGGSSASGFGNEAKIKKTASKKSGINAFARETERRAKIQENERRRQEKKARGAENRLGVVGGLLGKNAFQ